MFFIVFIRLPDISPTGQFPDWTFPRTDIFPTGQFPDRTFPRQTFHFPDRHFPDWTVDQAFPEAKPNR